MDESRTLARSLTGVRDAESAFAFIEWFAGEWPTPLRDGDGCTAEEVAAVEERLGLRLPASLAALYRLLGRRRDLTSNQDRLVPMNSLTVEDGSLIYRIEAEGCARWGVRVCDLGSADPPVVICAGYRDGSPWRPFLGSFSLAAVEMVLDEAVFAGVEERHDNRELDEAAIVRLEQQYERLPFPDYPAWWRPRSGMRSVGSTDPVSCSGRIAGPGFGYSRGTPRALPRCGRRCQESGSWPLSDAALRPRISAAALWQPENQPIWCATFHDKMPRQRTAISHDLQM